MLQHRADRLEELIRIAALSEGADARERRDRHRREHAKPANGEKHRLLRCDVCSRARAQSMPTLAAGVAQASPGRGPASGGDEILVGFTTAAAKARLCRCKTAAGR